MRGQRRGANRLDVRAPHRRVVGVANDEDIALDEPACPIETLGDRSNDDLHDACPSCLRGAGRGGSETMVVACDSGGRSPVSSRLFRVNLVHFGPRRCPAFRTARAAALFAVLLAALHAFADGEEVRAHALLGFTPASGARGE